MCKNSDQGMCKYSLEMKATKHEVPKYENKEHHMHVYMSTITQK